MKRIDIGGALRHHLWEHSTPFPLVEVRQLAPVRKAPYASYAQAVSMPMQASTYLETAAHLYPERIKITDLPLERLFTEAVVLKLPVGARSAITANGLQQALNGSGETVKAGDSVLVATGWDQMWDEPNYVSDAPYFTPAAIDWVLEREAGLVGSDSCQWDNGQQGFFPKFFQSEILLLGPLINLMLISQPRVRLITLPLKLEGVCAAPCRVIVEEG
jgi:arylformamidase